MIVGTAGHIDHGKTTLVHALTGVDTDRLPEEKKRGITIELGYASLSRPGADPISFVDVPGHEKLVRTMVAGASGIDLALLLVAADDGVMPQTREHLNILSLLGIRQGAVVITKSDRVEAALLAQRQQEAQALLDSHGLLHYPVMTVSAQTGDGIEALKVWLYGQADAATPRSSPDSGFRMGLDRVFTLDGIGTVVAGSVMAGQVQLGESVCLAHQPERHWRVRTLHVQRQVRESAAAGHRLALGLAGLERSAVSRGQTVCHHDIAQSSNRLDVLLKLLPGETTVLRSGTTVHVHLAALEVMASVALLGQNELEPGAQCIAQLVLAQAMPAWVGDAFVLRDASAQRTVGGGQVLDPQGPARYRQTDERLAQLRGVQAGVLAGDPQTQLQAALAHAPFGLRGHDWLQKGGWLRWPFDPQRLSGVVFGNQGEWVIAADRLQAHESRLLACLAEFHRQWPEDIGPDIRRARRLTAPRMPESMWEQLVATLAADARLARRGVFLHLPTHGEQLKQAERIVAERALPLLLDGRFDPPWVRDLCGVTRIPEAQMRSVMVRLAKAGEVYQIVKDLFYHPQVVQELAELVRDIFERDGVVEAAAFRDATGLGRKRAIQILEFFDRIGFTLRVGDQHLLRTRSPLFARERTT